MSIRRPPTAITLKPSDVTEMAKFIAEKNAKAAGVQDATKGGKTDMMVDRETKERKEKESRSRSDRIGM